VQPGPGPVDLGGKPTQSSYSPSSPLGARCGPSHDRFSRAAVSGFGNPFGDNRVARHVGDPTIKVVAKRSPAVLGGRVSEVL
jgi:hypothetical protein